MPSTQAKKEMFGKGKRSKQGGKTKKKTVKEQAAKRTAKAPEDDPAFIAPTVLNSTKYGSYAAVVFGGLSALAAVVPSLIKAFKGQTLPSPVIYGTFALAIICVIALTLLIMTDLRVRGDARIAAIKSGGAGEPEDAPGDDVDDVEEDEAVYESPAGAVPMAGGFTIKLHDGEGRLAVLAVGWNPKTGAPAYLAGKPGEKPEWIDDDMVQMGYYAEGPVRANGATQPSTS